MIENEAIVYNAVTEYKWLVSKKVWMKLIICFFD